MPRQMRTIADLRAQIGDGALSERALKRLRHDGRAAARDLAERELRRLAAAVAEQERLEVMLRYERELWGSGVQLIGGVDEVGVGPLAGPVIAGAVILPAGLAIAGVDDSKKLDAKARERLAVEIRARAIAVGLGCCSVAEIDKLNIYRASCEAMRRAVTALVTTPAHLLVDARRVPGVTMPQTAIIDGDAKSHSIAAASIVAKVERDRLMDEMAREHPGYGFENHKGYATPEHLEALERLGCCPLHRRSYAPVAAVLRKASGTPLSQQIDLFAAPSANS